MAEEKKKEDKYVEAKRIIDGKEYGTIKLRKDRVPKPGESRKLGRGTTYISQVDRSKTLSKEEYEQEKKDVRSGKVKSEFQRKQEEPKKEVLETAEETGVFEDRPEKVELSPTEEELERKKKFENRPGKLEERQIEATKNLLGDSYSEYAEQMGIEENYLDDLIQDPETRRQLLLKEIQREELNKAMTTNQKVGAALEPFLGDLKVFDVDVGGYVDQWFQMPKKDVETIVNSIGELESSVSGMTDSASQGEIGNPQEVLRDIAEKEKMLAVYEARIKRLIIASPELRANPEQVNLIEEKILAAKETFFEAKQRAAEGALITPSESQLFISLQEKKRQLEE